MLNTLTLIAPKSLESILIQPETGARKVLDAIFLRYPKVDEQHNQERALQRVSVINFRGRGVCHRADRSISPAGASQRGYARVTLLSIHQAPR